MNTTAIQWTDKSLNPIRARRKDGKNRVPGHFCQKISSGCTFCYASKMQPRFGMPQFAGTNKSADDQGLEVFLDEEVLQSVLRQRKPCKVFWCDMSDLFGDWVPFEWIDRCFAVMALTPHLTHQVLTKRPERMAEYLDDRDLKPEPEYPEADYISRPGHPQERIRDEALTMCSKLNPVPSLFDWPLSNVWLGTSCEDQKTADARIPELLKCPAAVRFLSLEPLLGAIDLSRWVNPVTQVFGTLTQRAEAIGWVIAGGESGSQARPSNIEWHRSIARQCKEAGVAFFMKQLGAKVIDHGTTSAAHFEESECWPDGTKLDPADSHRVLLKDPKGGDWNEWPEDLRIREFPRTNNLTPAGIAGKE